MNPANKHCNLVSYTKYVVLAILCILFFACRSPYDYIDNDSDHHVDQDSGSGTLTVSILSVGVKTLLPGIDMTPASYTVSGVGPNGSTFNVPTSEPTVTVSNLEFGDWSVTVDALNADPVVIARGVLSITLHTGETAVMNIAVTPLDGYGILDLELLWNTPDVDVPSISSELVLGSGTTLDLDFTLNGDGSASYTNNTIPSGYHSLVL